MIIVGEHGRTGGIASRVRGQREAYFEQRLASESHVDLLWHLARRDGFVCDVVVQSVATPYSGALCEWYARGPGSLLACEFFPEPVGSTGCITAAGDRTALNATFDSEPYPWLLLVRADHILKRLLRAVFDPRTTRITYTSPAQLDFNAQVSADVFRPNGGRTWPAIKPGLSIAIGGQGVTLVPRDLWRVYFGARTNWHDSMIKLELPPNNVPRTRLGFFIPTLHDADTSLGWNPLYRIAGRGEQCDWPSAGWVFDQAVYDATGDCVLAYHEDAHWATKAAFRDSLGVDDSCPPGRVV